MSLYVLPSSAEAYIWFSSMWSWVEREAPPLLEKVMKGEKIGELLPTVLTFLKVQIIKVTIKILIFKSLKVV